jgi:hypothetical protein
LKVSPQILCTVAMCATVIAYTLWTFELYYKHFQVVKIISLKCTQSAYFDL